MPDLIATGVDAAGFDLILIFSISAAGRETVSGFSRAFEMLIWSISDGTTRC
jgi:hypothetical protein